MGTGREAHIVHDPETTGAAAASYLAGRGACNSLMHVYVIPVAHDRYELYCEHDGADADAIGEMPPQGRFAKMYANFKEALARVEEERLSGQARTHVGPRSWTERM